MKTIVLTGGGTAGHVMPTIALLPYLKEYNIHYIGSYGIEKDIIKPYKFITYHDITSSKFRRNFSLKNLLLPYKVIKGIIESKKLLKKIKPDVIFSKGGYVAIPVVIAAHSLHIPIVTHESDISMGLANKIIARYADKVLCSFDMTMKNSSKYVHTGSPIRKSILCGNKDNIPNIARLSKNKKTILVFGGSLGAKGINDFVLSNIDKLCSRYNIIHITGKGKLDPTISHPHYIGIEYTSTIEDYFHACDYIVSRAGSNAIFEILALNKKAILIPLTNKSSRGEQLLNAEYFHKQNLVEILLEKELSLDNFIKKVDNLARLSTYHINIDSTNKKIVKEIESVL